jgi:hypothetical protein
MSAKAKVMSSQEGLNFSFSYDFLKSIIFFNVSSDLHSFSLGIETRSPLNLLVNLSYLKSSNQHKMGVHCNISENIGLWLGISCLQSAKSSVKSLKMTSFVQFSDEDSIIISPFH